MKSTGFLVVVCLLAAGRPPFDTPRDCGEPIVIIEDNASEEILAGGKVIVEAGGYHVHGALSVVGSNASQAVFAGTTPRAPIEVDGGGTFDAKWARFEQLSHLHPHTGAKILRLHDSAFADLGGTSLESCEWIDLSDLTSSDREGLPFSFNRVEFSDAQSPAMRVNIKSGPATPLLRMLGNSTTHGNKWGDAFDNDSAERILWHTGAIVREADSATFDTLQDALENGLTTAASVLSVTLGASAWIDANIDWNNHSYSNSTGPTIKNACIAPMAGNAVDDLDGGTARRGVFANCAFGRGNVNETTLNESTVFNAAYPLTGVALTVSNCTGTRALVGNAASGVSQSGNVWVSALLTATAGYFANSGAYDLHLVSPGGNLAIDEAPAGTGGSADWEGQLRGTGQKSGGTTSWDYGVDEYIGTTSNVPILSHSTNTPTSITWSWTNIPLESGYRGYPDSHQGGETQSWSEAADATSHVESGFTENQKITRHIHGFDGGGDFPASAPHSAYTSVHTPLLSDFTLTNGTNQVTVSVVPFPNQTQDLSARRIERSPNGSTGWITVQNWTSTTANFVDVVPGGVWHYRIIFRNGDADPTPYSSPQSVTVTGDSTAPAAPTDLTAVGVAGAVNLEWTAGTEDDLAGYTIWRSETQGTGYAQIGPSLVTTTTYSDTSAVSGATYYYVVKAKDGVGNQSNASNEASAIASAVGTLPAPTNLTVTPLNGANHLTWDCVEGAAGYRVLRSTSPTGPFTPHSPANKVVLTNEYRDAGLSNGTTYYYQVVAVK